MDEASDEEHASISREAATRRDRFWALGYREGLGQGKEAVLEASFHKGFILGAKTGRSLGRAQGVLACLQAMQGQLQGQQSSAARLVSGQQPLLTHTSTDTACRGMLAMQAGAGEQAANDADLAGLKQLQDRAQAIGQILQALQPQQGEANSAGPWLRRQWQP